MQALRAHVASDRSFYAGNAIVSSILLAVLGWILILREPAGDASALAFMPAVNASMNGLSASCLVAGWLAIRSKRRALHRNLMLAALGFSTSFLLGYLGYHFVHGDTPYPGTGAMRAVYLSVLASHVLLSIAVLPMVIATFWLSLSGRIERHRRLARWTLPIWLYVSVTGVVVFLMLQAAS